MVVIVGGALLADRFGRRVIVLTACVLCWVALVVIGGLGLVPLNDKVGGVLVSRLLSKLYVVPAKTEEPCL